MSANAQNTNIPTNAEQTTVIADAQETERIATVETPQRPSVFPLQANPAMPQNMNQTNTGAPTGPVPPRTAMPMPGGAPGAPAHSRIGAPHASSELEETPDFEQMPDMQQGGETGHSRGRRMPMEQQGPQDQQDENGSDSNSKSGESDSGKSSTESSDWLMEFFEIA